jgi:hypothetical protein
MKARDLAAEVLEVIGADDEFEHLVDDGEKVSQGANRGEGRSLGGAEEAASSKAFSTVCKGTPRAYSWAATRRSGGRIVPVVSGVWR